MVIAFAGEKIIAGDMQAAQNASKELKKMFREDSSFVFLDSLEYDLDFNGVKDKILVSDALKISWNNKESQKLSNKVGPVLVYDCNGDSIPDLVQKTEKEILVYVNNALPILKSRLFPIQEDSVLYIELANQGLSQNVNYKLYSSTDALSLKRDRNGVQVTPDENWYGNTELKIVYSRGNLQDSVNYSIIVLPANDAPYVYRERKTITIKEDGSVHIPVDSLLACVVDDDGNDELILKQLGNESRLRLLDQDYVYKPESNWFGEDSLLFMISDGEASDTLIQHIIVEAVNDAPQWSKIKSVSFPEDEYYQRALSFLYDHAHDVETPDSLLVFHVFSGEHVSISNECGKVTLIADANWYGSETVLLTVSDGEAKDSVYWHIDLTSVNDAPILSTIPDTVFLEDEKLFINRKELEQYAFDVETQASGLKWQIRKLGKIRAHYNGARIRCAGSEDWYGTDSLEVTVSDGELQDTRIWRMHILPVNDAPRFIISEKRRSFLEDETLRLKKTDLYAMVKDPETSSKKLNWTLLPSAHIYTEDKDNFYMLRADKNWYGQSAVRVLVNDGEYADTLNCKLRIVSVNDKPHISDIPAHSWKEDDTLGIDKSYLDNYVRDVETRRSDLMWSYFSDKPEIKIKKRKYGITLSSKENWNGSANIGLVVYDGGLRDTAFMKVKVDPVNDAPLWRALPDTSVAEDGSIILPLSFIKKYVSDPDMGDEVKLDYEVGKNFYIEEKKDGIEIWPKADWYGTDKIIFTASDGKKKSKKTWNIPVFAINDAPYFTFDLPDSISFRSNGSDTLFFNEIVHDIDNDQSELEWDISDGNITRHMIDEDIGGVIFFTENFSYGEDMITIRVSDGDDMITAYMPVQVREVDRFLMSNPVKLELLPNIPNPFRNYTDIRFSLPLGGHVTLKIYDLLGQEIITLANAYHDAQNYSIRWFGESESGMSCPSGVYLCRMSAVMNGEPVVKMRKMMLVR